MRKKISLVRRLSFIAGAVIAVYLMVSLVGGVVLIEGALHVPRLPVTRRAAFVESVTQWAGDGVSDVSTSGVDGVALRAWYVRPTVWNGDSVIVLHGVADNRQGVMHYAGMFLRAGYAVLLPDSRAHGESGGALATYGLDESEDVRRWSFWLAQMRAIAGSPKPRCTFLFGESMGAAIALQAPSFVCAVVAEAPFSSFREIGYERIAQRLGASVNFSHVAAWPMVNAAFLYARIRYGLDFEEASPERRLAESRMPALLIGGLDDRNIPLRHSERILAIAGKQNELWRVAGAGHTTAASVDSVEFERRVLDWFAGHSHRLA